MIYTALAVIWYTWVQAYTETHENIFLSPLHKDGGIGRASGLFLFLLLWAGGLEWGAVLKSSVGYVLKSSELCGIIDLNNNCFLV